jgi:hypothetical protein
MNLKINNAMVYHNKALASIDESLWLLFATKGNFNNIGLVFKTRKF